MLIISNYTKLFVNIIHRIKSSMLQADLNALYQWLVDWKLCFNVHEYSILHFVHLSPSQLYTLDRDYIPAKNIKKGLGVALSTNLEFTARVASAIKKKLNLF